MRVVIGPDTDVIMELSVRACSDFTNFDATGTFEMDEYN